MNTLRIDTAAEDITIRCGLSAWLDSCETMAAGYVFDTHPQAREWMQQWLADMRRCHDLTQRLRSR